MEKEEFQRLSSRVSRVEAEFNGNIAELRTEIEPLKEKRRTHGIGCLQYRSHNIGVIKRSCDLKGTLKKMAYDMEGYNRKVKENNKDHGMISKVNTIFQERDRRDEMEDKSKRLVLVDFNSKINWKTLEARTQEEP